MPRLIIRPGGLGDTVLLAPALAALREAGERSIHLVGYPERLEPLRAAGLVSRTWSLDRWMSSPEGVLGVLAEQGSVEDPERCAIESFFDRLPDSLPKRLAVRIHPPAPDPGSGIHVVDHLALSLGVTLAHPKSAPLAILLDWRRDDVENRIWMHPGGGGEFKRWPLERFLALGETLRQEQMEVRFLVGEAEAGWVETIAAHGIAVDQPDDPLALARLFRAENLFVGNDSGPGHLAALMGLRTLTIFGPTDPRMWAPWGPRARFLAPDETERWPSVERALLEAARILSIPG
ncbi:MAG: hypothetical protein HUU16_01775 [Candidatus Omnitrophica bacterium]|nr:hypothetical protein [Candidatus Omnitrophota bacterium]